MYTLYDADIFNKENAESVNKYKPLVEELYNTWEEYLNTIGKSST